MQHIISRHADDFQTKHGVAKAEIASHLETVFRQGKVEYSRITPKTGGYERYTVTTGNIICYPV